MSADLPALRILQIEDSSDDAELTCFELQLAGIHADCRRVDNEKDLRQALTDFQPDIVLSDLYLPGFSGMRALAIVREHDPWLPFVFFTGAQESEIAAIDTRSQETQWLSKDDGRRLPALVQQLSASIHRRSA